MKLLQKLLFLYSDDYVVLASQTILNTIEVVTNYTPSFIWSKLLTSCSSISPGSIVCFIQQGAYEKLTRLQAAWYTRSPTSDNVEAVGVIGLFLPTSGGA